MTLNTINSINNMIMEELDHVYVATRDFSRRLAATKRHIVNTGDKVIDDLSNNPISFLDEIIANHGIDSMQYLTAKHMVKASYPQINKYSF